MEDNLGEPFNYFHSSEPDKFKALAFREYDNPDEPIRNLADPIHHRSLLQWASIRGWEDVCKLLITQYQCDPHYEDDNKWTVLHNVCRNGHIDLVRYFCEHCNMDPLKKNGRRRSGITPRNYTLPEFSRYSVDHSHITEYLDGMIKSRIHKAKTHVNNFKKAVKSKGSLNCYMVQCMPFGPPRVGKTCLYHLLVNKPPPGTPTTADKMGSGSESTSALTGTRMVQIIVKDPQGVAQPILAEGSNWSEVRTPGNEIAIFMKNVNLSPVEPNVDSSICMSVQPLSHMEVDPEENNIKSTVSPEEAVIDAFTRQVMGGHLDISQLQALADQLMIFFTDTGGQPEFQEVLPALVAGPTIFLLLLNLRESLDSKYKVKYESSTNNYEVYDSSFTVREVLMQGLSSISSYHSVQIHDFCKHTSLKCGAPPINVLSIGTHRDLVSEEQVAEINLHFQESIALTTDSIIEPYEDDMYIIPVNNYNSEDGSKVRGVFERIIKRDMSGYKIELPVPWLGLLLFLRHKGSFTITFSKCLELATKFNISDEDELKSCLCYLHYKTGTIRYYANIDELKDTVIIQPSVIFTAVTDFITSTFTLEKVTPAMQKSFKKLGLFKLSEVQHVFDKHKRKLEISFTQFTALLRHMNILVPAHNKDYDYFLPCALVHAPESSAADVVPTNAVGSLFILFNGGFVPKGVCSGLLGFLCMQGWSIAYDHSCKPRLYRNQAVLSFELKECLDSINCIIQCTATHIELSFEDCHDKVHIICPYIRETISRSMPEVCSQLQYKDTGKFAIRCKHKKCIDMQEHLAEVCDGNQRGRCTLTKSKYSLNIQDLHWFADVEVAPAKIIFDLLKSKCKDWPKIGQGLGVAHDYLEGFHEDVIRSDESKLECVINKWVVSQQCSEVPLRHLMVVMENIGLIDVAKEIEAEYIHHSSLEHTEGFSGLKRKLDYSETYSHSKRPNEETDMASSALQRKRSSSDSTEETCPKRSTNDGLQSIPETSADNILSNDDSFIVLLRLTRDITDWSVLALLLDLSSADLEHIKINNSTVQSQHQAIIKQWLDSGRASWSALVSALRDPLVNKGALADEIMKQHPTRGDGETESKQPLLPKSPQLVDAHRLIKSESCCWNSLGLGLKVSFNDREEFKTMYETNSERLEAVLNKWIQSETVAVTWERLLQALEEIELRSVIRNIQEFLKTDEALKIYNSLPDWTSI